MTATFSNTTRLASVRKSIKDELAQVDAQLLEASAEIARAITEDGTEPALNAAIMVRQSFRDQRNRLFRTDLIINESDSLYFIIPNLICMSHEYKVDGQTLNIISDLLGG